MRSKTLAAANGGPFWVGTAILCGLIAGGIFGFVISELAGQGASSGLMVGALIFVVTSWLFARFAMGAPLPAPNTVKAPRAPAGGKYAVPGGAPSSSRRSESEPTPDAHDIGVSVGQTLQSAREAISGVVSGAAERVGAVMPGRESDRQEAGAVPAQTEDGARIPPGSDARPLAPEDHPGAPASDSQAGPVAPVPGAPVSGAMGASATEGDGSVPREARTDPAGTPAPAEQPSAPGATSVSEAPPATPPEPYREPIAEPASSAGPAVSSDPANVPADQGTEPQRLDAPRDGQPDDLRRISGIGPVIQDKLNEMGIYHYDQIAAWSDEEVTWVESHLEGFQGRATRDGWVDHAKTLASGGETDFAGRVDKGDIY